MDAVRCPGDGAPSLYVLRKRPWSSGGGSWQEVKTGADMGFDDEADFYPATMIPDGIYPGLDC